MTASSYRSTDRDIERGHTLRMCGLKTTFYSEADAMRRCQEIADPNSKSNKKSHKKPAQMRPYQCPVCNCWHLTKQVGQ